MNKTNILISCATGLKNSGDEAMLQSIISQLKSNFDCKIKVFSFDPEFTREFHQVEAINHSLLKHPLNTIRNIKECDFFILGSGGLLQDETSLGNIPFWLLKLFFALRFGKKTFVYANSIGPIKYNFNKSLIKIAFNQVDAITVRDNQSKKLLKKIGIKNSIQVTADPAFSLSLPENEETHALLKKEDLQKGYVTVFLRHWFDTHPLIPVNYCVKFNLRSRKDKEKWNQLVNKFVKITNWINQKLDLNVVYLTMCPDRDNKIPEAILAKVKNQTRNKSINSFYNPQKIIGLINKSKLVIGMRLHSIIYSIVANKPFVSLAYSKKVWGILNDLGMKNKGVNVEKFTSDQFITLIKETLNNYSEEKKQIKEFYKKAKKAEQKNVIQIKKLLIS